MDELLLLELLIGEVGLIRLHRGDLLGGLPVVVLGVDEAEDGVDQSPEEDGDEVAGEHGGVAAGGVEVHAPVLHLGHGEPGDETEQAAGDGAGDGAGGVCLAPEE